MRGRASFAEDEHAVQTHASVSARAVCRRYLTALKQLCTLLGDRIMMTGSGRLRAKHTRCMAVTALYFAQEIRPIGATCPNRSNGAPSEPTSLSSRTGAHVHRSGPQMGLSSIVRIIRIMSGCKGASEGAGRCSSCAP